jgi:hypothetical protein
MRKPKEPSRLHPPASVPHDRDREGRQPYAKEVEDYSHGVAAPPGEQGRREAESEIATKRTGKPLGTKRPGGAGRRESHSRRG